MNPSLFIVLFPLIRKGGQSRIHQSPDCDRALNLNW